jgi:hypothetical protein
VGGRWTGGLLWLVLAAGWAAIGFLSLRGRIPALRRSGAQNGETARHPAVPTRKKFHFTHFVLLFLLLVGLAARFLAVRDMAFPLWVDAGRHGLITAIMAESGQVISDYRPWLPVDRFPYHYGFHTIAAGLAQMTDRPLPDLLLVLGQLLNGLVPLTLYAGGWLFTRRRLAGWLAAFLAALPFFFPAYYATWGRMTQLTGVLVLPVVLAVTWQLVRGSGRWRERGWLVSLLAGGLFLIHFRVFLFDNGERITGKLLPGEYICRVKSEKGSQSSSLPFSVGRRRPCLFQAA